MNFATFLVLTANSSVVYITLETTKVIKELMFVIREAHLFCILKVSIKFENVPQLEQFYLIARFGV
jgi:hypothetical protein